jgi:hypothetical protein
VNAFIATLIIVTTARFGLLAAMVWQLFFYLSIDYSLTTNLSAWYFGTTLFALNIMVGLAVYGFYTSLAGQSLFGGRLLRD